MAKPFQQDAGEIIRELLMISDKPAQAKQFVYRQ